MLLCSVSLMAQNAMRVHYNDGTEQDIFLSQVDSITFVEKSEPEEKVTLTGGWLWGRRESGYYELLVFNDDYTYTGYDRYFTYGFDTMTYGFYSQYGTMLTLWSNGFGYQHRYNWYIMGLTTNALTVMTKMGAFTYYKLQSDVIRLSNPGSYMELDDVDSIVFTDGVVVRAEGNKLHAIASGTTYVLIRKAEEDKIYAYKVVVM
jgi:hypothetical protein